MTDRTLVIAVPTYRRADLLAGLLTDLSGLPAPVGTALQIIVVDNDPKESARPVATSARTGHPITYVTEPRKGLARVRNRAVAWAQENEVDLIAFIDDDERPSADWLIELLSVLDETSADGVAGPVLPTFDEAPPAWLIDGGGFRRRRSEHGSRIPDAGAGSLVLRTSRLACEPFDLRFNLSGAEDVKLMTDLVGNGGDLRWSDRGLVHEHVPPDRLKATWHLRRRFSDGQNNSRILLTSDPGFNRKLRRAMGGLLTIATSLSHLTRLRRSPKAAAFGLAMEAAEGAGLISGLFDQALDRYDRESC